MKNLFLLAALRIFFLASGQKTDFDQDPAEELGADEYGMKMYTFVILKTGTVKIADADSSDSIMRGHLDNIKRLAEEKLLTVAGPFGKNDLNYRGLFILNVATVEEALKLLETDPAISAGVFETEIIPWYGSAALPLYQESHEKVAKKNP